MGQSSSQIAPSQVPPSASKSWLLSPFTQRKAAPQKRAREEDSEEEARKPKRSKANEQDSPKERKANRAIPQHRRGTSIKPRDNARAVKTVDGDSEQNDGDMVVVAQSPSTNDESNIHTPAGNVSGRVKRTKSNVAELTAGVGRKQSKGGDEEELKDGAIVNGIGAPGPRKKKSRKDKGSNEDATSQAQHVDHQISANDVAAFDECMSQDNIKKEGLVVSPIGKPGPKRSMKMNKQDKERKALGPVNTSTMAEDGDYRPSAMRQFQSEDRGTVTGKWSQEEIELADRVFQDFCRDNGISEPELKLKTTNWATIGPLKVKLYEAFPLRTITNIRRHCQRRFSPYEKGPWSDEESQRLKDAYAKYPEDWPQIAREVERNVQACRDHWKNQVKYEATMDRGPWSMAEEATLVKIVEDAIALIVETTEDAKVKRDPVKAESMINWDEIASKMDGKRNHKQCFEKWRLLKRRTKKPQAQNKLAPASENNEDQHDVQKKSSKQRWLDQEYAKMTPGDIYEALYELHQVLIELPRAGFHEESTLWSVVALHRDKASRFKATSLLRKTLMCAAVTYDCKRVRKAKFTGMKVYGVLKKMHKLATKGKLDICGKSYTANEQEVARIKIEKKTGLSEETLVNSDDEVEDVDGEDVDNVEIAEAELVIPETQSQQAIAGAEEEEEDEAEVNLTFEEWEKCKKVGKKQHRAYLKGYGR